MFPPKFRSVRKRRLPILVMLAALAVLAAAIPAVAASLAGRGSKTPSPAADRAAAVATATAPLRASAATAPLRASVRHAAASDCTVPVTTSDGVICGVSQDNYSEYLGIPYAAPPTGALRWRAPQPVAAWSTPYQATAPGPSCSSVEDCLWLSVYVPPNATPSSNLPVLFWIHGGAFAGDDNSGSGIGLGVGSGQDLANAENVIVVRVSYRLGIFGGLVDSVFGPNAGDYGVEDQTAALRWVNANIAEFGGDPRNVTIDGQSAGGVSVCDQILSPEARGLFEKAIVESGTWNSATLGSNCMLLNTPSQVAAVAQEVQQDLGCTSGDIATCLRNAPYSTIQSLPISQFTSPFPYFPVLNRTYLPIQPATALRTGQFNHVRVIVGNAQNDFGYPPSTTTWAAFAQAMQNTWGPALTKKILAVYSAANYPSAGVAEADTLSDHFFCAANTLTNDLSRWVTTYEYRYDDGTEPYYGGVTNQLAGAFHSSELPALFPGWFNVPMTGPDQQAMIQTMQTYWGSFARSGQLSGQGELPWPPYSDHMRGSARSARPADDSSAQSGSIMSLLPAFDNEVLNSSVLDGTHNCSLWDTTPP